MGECGGYVSIGYGCFTNRGLGLCGGKEYVTGLAPNWRTGACNTANMPPNILNQRSQILL